MSRAQETDESSQPAQIVATKKRRSRDPQVTEENGAADVADFRA